MSYFTSMRLATYRGIETMPPHAHDVDTICLPVGGTYVERTRGRETVHCLGDVLFCPAGEPHSQIFPSGPVLKLLIAPNLAAHDYLSGHIRLGDAPFTRSGRLAALATRLADELRRADIQSPLIAEGLGLEILGQFARIEAADRLAPAWLAAARDFVATHADRPVRLADVAAHVGCDGARLATAYRCAFGCTIGEDARAARLRRAAALLASTGERIAWIALDCGFFDQAHFSKTFKRAYGVTPRGYRASFH